MTSQTVMVEMTGLEPAASWSQTKHSTNLNYISIGSIEALGDAPMELSQKVQGLVWHPAVTASSALEAFPIFLRLLFLHYPREVIKLSWRYNSNLWCQKQDSNLQPADYKSAALPIVLSWHRMLGTVGSQANL